MNADRPQPDTRSLRDYVGLVTRGFAMGAANIVPGVSGGTMALILGIYEELLDSIKAVMNREAIAFLLRFKIGQALELLPWKFLAAVAAGIFLATLTMSYALEWILENYAALLWAFFFGLVLASVLTISRRIGKWSISPIVGVLLGAVGAYVLVGLVPAETPDTWWFWFLSGALAISAMVLPGLSGAFILVLLGKYQDLLAAVTNQDFVTLILVIAGAGIGIVSFAQFLSWLFKRYHDPTVALLMGMLIGSLRKIWPWKETLSTTIDRHGEVIPLQQINVLPSAFNWEVIGVILLAAAGCALILGLTAWAARAEVKK